MPEKIEAYKCSCVDCMRFSQKCNSKYSTYSGAYNHERECRMALHNRACATCKHYITIDKTCKIGQCGYLPYSQQMYCAHWEINDCYYNIICKKMKCEKFKKMVERYKIIDIDLLKGLPKIKD